MSPQRIQRRRTRGWHMPAGAVYVGRPTRWGNPFLVTDCVEHESTTVGEARRRCADLYRDWLTGELDAYGPPGSPWSREAAERLLAALPELRGRDLACWCLLPEPGQPDHCHAAVLLRLANAPEPALPGMP